MAPKNFGAQARPVPQTLQCKFPGSAPARLPFDNSDIQYRFRSLTMTRILRKIQSNKTLVAMMFYINFCDFKENQGTPVPRTILAEMALKKRINGRSGWRKNSPDSRPGPLPLRDLLIILRNGLGILFARYWRSTHSTACRTTK